MSASGVVALAELDTMARQAMTQALALAQAAARNSEIPVGAVVYDDDGIIIGEGQNSVIARSDPAAHAEILALRQAAQVRQNYRLPDCHMAVTLEPCLMCAGAVFHARLKTLTFAAADPKTGALGSVAPLHLNKNFNHHTQVVGGVMAEHAAALLHDFFRRRR